MLVEGTAISEIEPQALDGLFGDGVAATKIGAGSSVTLSGSRIERVARAGVAVFGAHASLSNSLLSCNPLDLVGNDFPGAPMTFENLGGNFCGCEELAGCKVLSPTLEPPTPVP